MTTHDEQVLNERSAYFRQLLKEQHALPKDQRDQKVIDEAKQRIQKIGEWLGTRSSPIVQSHSQMSRDEFKSRFKNEMEVGVPEATMRIENLEQLNKAWPSIVGKNIMIEAPPAVKDEIARRLKKLYRKSRVNGFR
jgi:hypothetical protein